MFLPPVQGDIPDYNIAHQAFIDYHN